MDFVPPEHRTDPVPCHHIPLNYRGQTVEELSGDQLRLEESLGGWLRWQIAKLEKQRAS